MWQFIPQPVLSLIFLYEIKDLHKEVIYQAIQDENQQALLELEKPVFIEQKVSNACGTIALLHSITNTSQKIEGSCKKDSLLEKLINSWSNGEDLAKIAEEDKDLETIHMKFAVQGN